jgi:mannose-6-phosphate isomerase-like protein (cupin superfamily)
MARPGQTIVNHRTGQEMTFLKTGGETEGSLLQIDCLSPTAAPREPEHVHPRQETRFEVRSGLLGFRVEGDEQEVGAGGTFTIAPNARHQFWAKGDEPARYIQEFRPALHIDQFFETLFALAEQGKLNEKGMPGLLQMMAIVPEHQEEIRPTNPPWAVVKALSSVLTPVARWRGYPTVIPYR